MSIAVRSINVAEVFAESLRSELNSYTYQPIQEGTDEFFALKTLYDDFLKNGNLEKFYSASEIYEIFLWTFEERGDTIVH